MRTITLVGDMRNFHLSSRLVRNVDYTLPRQTDSTVDKKNANWCPRLYRPVQDGLCRVRRRTETQGNGVIEGLKPTLHIYILRNFSFSSNLLDFPLSKILPAGRFQVRVLLRSCRFLVTAGVYHYLDRLIPWLKVCGSFFFFMRSRR